MGRVVPQKQETRQPTNPWQTTRYTYTDSDKIATITSPEGHITRSYYDDADRLKESIDAENRRSQYHYYVNGQVDFVTRYLQNNPIEVAKYTYTDNGQQKTVTDAEQNATEHFYDDFDRLELTQYPDASFEQNQYDPVGNVIEFKTRAGQLVSYEHDALNRLTLKTLPQNQITYGYDLSGLRKTISDSKGYDYTYQYDSAGRVKNISDQNNRNIAYQYDNNGNRTELTYPDNYKVRYEYDELERLDKVIEVQSNSLLADYEYNARSQRTFLRYANGAEVSSHYKIDGALVRLQHTLADIQPTYAYLYNKVNQITEQYSSSDIPLWQASSNIGIPIVYTPNHLNQYAAVGGQSYQYDNNANLSSDGINNYQYDLENHLISAQTPNHNVTYAYDPIGRRAAKVVDGHKTEYLYDGVEVLLEYNQAGTIQARYIYGSGIDQPILMEKGGQRYYYHTDHQGSVIALSDGNTGAVVEQYSYGPYGESNDGSSVGNPYRYTGRRLDEETGLYYYRARMYSADIGRFLQPDPIGYGDGLNLYAYVGNDPVNLVDPFGLTGRSSNGFSLGSTWGSLTQRYDNAKREVQKTAQGLKHAATQNPYLALTLQTAGADSTVNDVAEGNFSNVAVSVGLGVTTRGVGVAKSIKPALKLGKHKSFTKWKNRFKRGEWTAKDARETYKTGKKFKADNLVNKGNSATRYHNQKLDKSIVVDDVTGEIIQLGKKGFKY